MSGAGSGAPYPASPCRGTGKTLGVFVTIMIEIGMLTPPVGVNLFVMLAIARGKVTMSALGWECLPYWIMLVVGTALMTLFPDIALWLPRAVY